MTTINDGEYGLSLPDLDEVIERAWDKISSRVAATGCGSTEYVFKSKDDRHIAVRLLTDELESLVKNLRRGYYDVEFGDGE